MMNNSYHTNLMAEIDKMMIIADKQVEAEIITDKQYRKIMFLLIDKSENYIQSLEKIDIPKIEVKNFRSIDLFNLTKVLFCTG